MEHFMVKQKKDYKKERDIIQYLNFLNNGIQQLTTERFNTDKCIFKIIVDGSGNIALDSSFDFDYKIFVELSALSNIINSGVYSLKLQKIDAYINIITCLYDYTSKFTNFILFDGTFSDEIKKTKEYKTLSSMNDDFNKLKETLKTIIINYKSQSRMFICASCCDVKVYSDTLKINIEVCKNCINNIIASSTVIYELIP